jgi:hypothetical protein
MIVFAGNDNANTMLGMFATIFSAVAVVVMFGYRFVRSKKAQLYIVLVASIIPVSLAIGLLVKVDLLTLLLFQAGYVAVAVIPRASKSTLTLNLMNRLGHPGYTAERNVLGEVFYLLGRLVALSLFIVAYYTHIYVFQAAIFAIMTLHAIAFFLAKILYRDYNMS